MKKSLIFGPVLSRRLGYSLGIDLLPFKTCNQDCLYCEVAKSNNITEKRENFININNLISQIKQIKGEIDYITLAGSGEPTLHANLDQIIRSLKQNFNSPIVLITNSLLLSKAEVREELLDCDIVLPSLDAVQQKIFQQLNRPIKNVNITGVIDGLIAFRKKFKGQIWLEILFCKNINDSKEHILDFKKAINKINPDKIQLNSVDRPPAYSTALSLSLTELQQIAELLDDDRVEIISKKQNSKNNQPLTLNGLISNLKLRPAIFEDLTKLYAANPKEIREMLLGIQEKGVITKVIHNHQLFFISKTTV